LRYATNGATETELEPKMTFRHISCEIASERLLLVVLEEKQYPCSEYRHIRATVVRRAVPHVKSAHSDTIATWNDDYEGKCTGYRVASYSSTKKNAVYVDDLELRGQIDAMPKPCRDGRPYGNKVVFKPYQLEMRSAKCVFEFFQKMENFKTKNNLNRGNDDFYEELHHLATFLGITTILFRTNTGHGSLAETRDYEECTLAAAAGQIDKLLAPFLQIAA
jgi:hypothetical protein